MSLILMAIAGLLMGIAGAILGQGANNWKSIAIFEVCLIMAFIAGIFTGISIID